MPNLPWVEQIKERLAKATPGPWALDERSELAGMVYCDDSLGSRVANCMPAGPTVLAKESVLANADLIAHTPEDYARLLRAVEVLGEAVEEVKRITYPGYITESFDLTSIAEFRKNLRSANAIACRALATLAEVPHD